MLTTYVGVSVIAVGLVLMLVGVAMAWKESRKLLGPASNFVDSLTSLVKALAGAPQSTVLFAFGTLLVFLGGLITGVGAL